MANVLGLLGFAVYVVLIVVLGLFVMSDAWSAVGEQDDLVLQVEDQDFR